MFQQMKYTGTVVPMDIINVDTDNIIPKQFLKETTRTNLSQYLFFNWRYLINNSSKKLNLNFILNKPNYKNASILLSRNNFGCGSSREHAVWALVDYGFKIIIASSFADIFYKNSFNNSLLPIVLSESKIQELFEMINPSITTTFTIDIQKQKIYTTCKTYLFQINEFYRNRILNKLDDITLTLKHTSSIKKYEENQPIYFK